MNKKGFTLIELLIVITIIGIVAVAVLSAINPVEQIYKANDSRRKSDIAELLNALERYYTTFDMFPATLDTTARCPTFDGTDEGDNCTNTLDLQELIDKNELKTAFARRQLDEYFVTGSVDDVNVCFTPQSETFQAKALRTASNDPAGGSRNYICVPE